MSHPRIQELGSILQGTKIIKYKEFLILVNDIDHVVHYTMQGGYLFIYLFFWFTLQLLELEVEIERNKTTLKSLQDLDHMYRW